MHFQSQKEIDTTCSPSKNSSLAKKSKNNLSIYLVADYRQIIHAQLVHVDLDLADGLRSVRVDEDLGCLGVWVSAQTPDSLHNLGDWLT